MQIDLSSLHRLITAMIQIGTIDEVQAEPLRYRVTFDGIRKSWWLRHGVDRAHNASSWNPYEKGEQVLCLLPGGNWDGAIICAMYSEQHPQPETSLDKFVRTMKDGARIEYNSSTHELNAVLPEKGKVSLIAKGGVFIDGPLKVTEDISSEQQIRDKKSSMQTMRDLYNAHTNGPSPPPDPQM